MRRFVVLLGTMSMLFALFAPAASAAQTPYCGITWGSLPKSAAPFSAGPVTGARVGQHECFDRLVIDVANNTEPTGYRVEYVRNVIQDGSGNVIPLAGGAKLQVTVKAPAYDGGGDSTIDLVAGQQAANVAGFRTFREVKFAGSFEGYTTFGLGVRARLPFRVFTLVSEPGQGDARTRIVIDVAHRW